MIHFTIHSINMQEFLTRDTKIITIYTISVVTPTINPAIRQTIIAISKPINTPLIVSNIQNLINITESSFPDIKINIIRYSLISFIILHSYSIFIISVKDVYNKWEQLT